jgi:hypothetical protein
MTHCVQCGSEVQGKYKNRQYCNSTCRSRRRRALIAEATQQQQQQQQQEQRAQLRLMLEQMSKIAPKTASSVKTFVDTNGFDCGFSAVKLCLQFHQETAMTA